MEGMDRCSVCRALAFWRDDERAWLCAECWHNPAMRPLRAKMGRDIADVVAEVDDELRAKGGER